MLSSSSTLLSLSITPHKSTSTLVPGQIDPEATCPACSLDVGHQVSLLVQRYEQLQDMVSSLAASRPSKKAKLQSQVSLCSAPSQAGCRWPPGVGPQKPRGSGSHAGTHPLARSHIRLVLTQLAVKTAAELALKRAEYREGGGPRLKQCPLWNTGALAQLQDTASLTCQRFQNFLDIPRRESLRLG